MVNIFDIGCMRNSIVGLINSIKPGGVVGVGRPLALLLLYNIVLNEWLDRRKPLRLGLIKNGNHYIAKPLRGDDFVSEFLSALRGVRVLVIIVDEGNELLDRFIARVTTYRWWPAIYIPRRLNVLAENYWLSNEPLRVFLGKPNRRCVREVVTYSEAIEYEWRSIECNVTNHCTYPMYEKWHIGGDP
ncbi:hypothetical protein JCM16161A_22210 [Vulcanisaeta sp. JCM 16161]|uniref:hypothetical protein n=1 Tax=Vulcanisaeta sp. JCM 16161 TaxID=1295372 RepID=UPI0006CFB596|nr:hypothetical protein [Vulcanisaeta sp. JCM 16161]